MGPNKCIRNRTLNIGQEKNENSVYLATNSRPTFNLANILAELLNVRIAKSDGSVAKNKMVYSLRSILKRKSSKGWQMGANGGF